MFGLVEVLKFTLDCWVGLALFDIILCHKSSFLNIF